MQISLCVCINYIYSDTITVSMCSFHIDIVTPTVCRYWTPTIMFTITVHMYVHIFLVYDLGVCILVGTYCLRIPLLHSKYSVVFVYHINFKKNGKIRVQ